MRIGTKGLAALALGGMLSAATVLIAGSSGETGTIERTGAERVEVTARASAPSTVVGAAAPEGGANALGPDDLGLPIIGGPDKPPAASPEPQTVPGGHDVSWAAGVPKGQYRALVDVQSSQATRVDLTVAGQMVGTYGVGTTARRLEALLHVDGPDSLVGVRSSVPVTVLASQLVPVAPTFTTRGTSIIAPDGNVWRFESVNRSGYELAPDGTPSLNQFDHEGESMWAWGFTSVRLPLNQEYWLANCEVSQSWVHPTAQRADGSKWRYRDLIDAEIAEFTSQGLLVLIDLHVSSRGYATGCEAKPEAAVLEMPDSRSVLFWRSVAERYRTDPMVAFDLYNEPHLHDSANPPSYADAQRIWRDGGTVSYRDHSGVLPRTSTYETIGMQALYQEVRATGATNLVFVGGLYYAHRPEVMINAPLDATGLVASVHMYCLGCAEIPPSQQTQFIDGERPGEPDRVGVGDRYPTVITEFGSDEWWDGHDNRRYLEYFQSRGFGWSVWTWAGGGLGTGRSPYGILAEPTQAAATRAPGAAGVPIWDALASRRAARG